MNGYSFNIAKGILNNSLEFMSTIKTTTMEVRKRLSANIRAGRQRLGLSQEKFAEMAALSTQTISDIEGCRTWVSDNTLLKLSEILKMDIYQLLMPSLLDEMPPNFFLQQKINMLRQTIRDDIDKRLDQFLS